MLDIQELIAAARDGSTRAAGRLLTLVESARRGEVLASRPQPARTMGHKPALAVCAALIAVPLIAS